MGCVAVGHTPHYDLQRSGQGSSMRDRVAGAPGCLLQSFHILHLLHWILPATGGHMSLLPAHYSQGKRPACTGAANMSVSVCEVGEFYELAFCHITHCRGRGNRFSIPKEFSAANFPTLKHSQRKAKSITMAGDEFVWSIRASLNRGNQTY